MYFLEARPFRIHERLARGYLCTSILRVEHDALVAHPGS